MAAITIAGAYVGVVLGAALGVGAPLAADAFGVASPALVELGVAAAVGALVVGVIAAATSWRWGHRRTSTR